MQDPVGICRLDVLQIYRVAQLQLSRETSLRPLRPAHVLSLLVFRATLCSDRQDVSLRGDVDAGRIHLGQVRRDARNPSSACHTSIGIPIGVEFLTVAGSSADPPAGTDHPAGGPNRNPLTSLQPPQDWANGVDLRMELTAVALEGSPDGGSMPKADTPEQDFRDIWVDTHSTAIRAIKPWAE